MIQITLTQERNIGTDAYSRVDYHALYDSVEKAQMAFGWLNSYRFGELIRSESYWKGCAWARAYAERGDNECRTKIKAFDIEPRNFPHPFEWLIERGDIKDIHNHQLTDDNY